MENGKWKLTLSARSAQQPTIARRLSQANIDSIGQHGLHAVLIKVLAVGEEVDLALARLREGGRTLWVVSDRGQRASSRLDPLVLRVLGPRSERLNAGRGWASAGRRAWRGGWGGRGDGSFAGAGGDLGDLLDRVVRGAILQHVGSGVVGQFRIALLDAAGVGVSVGSSVRVLVGVGTITSVGLRVVDLVAATINAAGFVS